MQDVLAGSATPAAWLPKLPVAMSAIALGSHRSLVEQVICVLASTVEGAGSPGAPGGDAAGDAAKCVLALLQHPSDLVQDQTWAVLHRLLPEDASCTPVAQRQTAQSLRVLLSNDVLMRQLMLTCLADTAGKHAGAAAAISACMIRDERPDIRRSRLSSWSTCRVTS